jgi:hypothetical protein
VLVHRLSRVVDRARHLEANAAGFAADKRRIAIDDLAVLAKRMAAANWAIALCTMAALLVCLVVAVVFVSAVARLDLALLVVPLFVAAMGWLMAAVVLFLIEMQLAAEQLRRRF